MTFLFFIFALIVGRIAGSIEPTATTAYHWIQHSYWLDSTCSTEYAGEIGFGAETCYPSEQTSFALGPYVLVYYNYYGSDVETIFYYYSDSGCYDQVGYTQSNYESEGCTYDSAYNLYYKELVLTAVPTAFPADGTLVTMYESHADCQSETGMSMYFYQVTGGHCLPYLNGSYASSPLFGVEQVSTSDSGCSSASTTSVPLGQCASTVAYDTYTLFKGYVKYNSTLASTYSPTVHPTVVPSRQPTVVPSHVPTTPTIVPSVQPSQSAFSPTVMPSKIPTRSPSSASPTTSVSYVVYSGYLDSGCSTLGEMVTVLANTCLYNDIEDNYFIYTCDGSSVVSTVYSNSACTTLTTSASISLNSCYEEYQKYVACGTTDPYYSYPSYTFPTSTFYYDTACSGTVITVNGYVEDVCIAEESDNEIYSLKFVWPEETTYFDSSTCSSTASQESEQLSSSCVTVTTVTSVGITANSYIWQEVPGTTASSPTVRPTGATASNPTVRPSAVPTGSTHSPTSSAATAWIEVSYYSDSACSVYAGEQGFALGTCYALYTGEYAKASYSLLNNGDPTTFQYSVTTVTYYDSECTEEVVSQTTDYYGNCHYSSGFYYTTNLIDAVPTTFGADGALLVVYPTNDECSSQSSAVWYSYNAYNSDVCMPSVDGLYMVSTSCGTYQFCELGQTYSYGDYVIVANECDTTAYSTSTSAYGTERLTCYKDGGTTIVTSDSGGGGGGSSSSSTIVVAAVVPIVVVVFAALLAYYYFVVNGGAWRQTAGPMAAKAEDTKTTGSVEINSNA